MRKKRKKLITDPVARRKYWFTHISDYLSSGMSLREYCDKNDVSQYSLRDWLTKAKAEETAREMAAATSTQNSNWRQPVGQFLQVQVCDDQAVQALAIEPGMPTLKLNELYTPGGFRLSMMAEFGFTELVSLLRELKEAGC